MPPYYILNQTPFNKVSQSHFSWLYLLIIYLLQQVVLEGLTWWTVLLSQQHVNSVKAVNSGVPSGRSGLGKRGQDFGHADGWPDAEKPAAVRQRDNHIRPRWDNHTASTQLWCSLQCHFTERGDRTINNREVKKETHSLNCTLRKKLTLFKQIMSFSMSFI